MTIISFAKSRYVGDMIEGTKTTTIRRNWEKWVKALEARHNLHVYYGSHWSRNRKFVGECTMTSVKVVRGSQFTDADARADGFKDVDELLQALVELNDMTLAEVRSHKWAIITFGVWVRGPNWDGETGTAES